MTEWEGDLATYEERLTADSAPGSIAGHEPRYRLAAGYYEPGDTVLDAACGTGYGVRFARLVRWVGVDIADCVDSAYQTNNLDGTGVNRRDWVQADLCDWRPDFDFDVAISFETLEHVKDPEFLVATLCMARRLVICSVPVVPTVGTNPYHLHNFEATDLPELFDVHGWRLHQYLWQPSEVSGIYIFSP